MTDLTDYAGLYGRDVGGVYANLTEGNITYKVHTKGGKWLPEVVNRTDYAGIYGKAIDGLMMKTNTGKTIKYAVHLKNLTVGCLMFRAITKKIITMVSQELSVKRLTELKYIWRVKYESKIFKMA